MPNQDFPALLANCHDGVAPEMSNTKPHAARSNVIAAAKDFSYVIVTADDRLISVLKGRPLHIQRPRCNGRNEYGIGFLVSSVLYSPVSTVSDPENPRLMDIACSSQT